MSTCEHPRAFSVPILGVQPSQFYISREKLARVMDDLEAATREPLPVKTLRGITVLTDGHTRAFALYRSGAKYLWVVNDEDELDWEAYLACVSECRQRGVRNVSDLDGRVISAEDYELNWRGWCDVLHAKLEAEREATRHAG